MQPKLKLLKILDILRETDKTHPITAPAICLRLADMGISAERKSVCRDIKTLVEYGYKITLCHDNKLGYYMEEKKGSVDKKRSRPSTLDLVHFTLEFKREDKDAVYSILGKGDVKEDGEYVVADYALSGTELFPTLLTLGEVAKLTAPTELKEEFEKKLEAVMEFYKKRRVEKKIEVWLL